jgi:pyruvate dehydrogenase E1 component
VARCLAGDAPVVAASDYVRAWPQSIAGSFEAPYTVLGTDGFGRSDTRAALRSFFEVNREHIVLATLDALARAGRIDRALCAQAIQRYGIDTEAGASWNC